MALALNNPTKVDMPLNKETNPNKSVLTAPVRLIVISFVHKSMGSVSHKSLIVNGPLSTAENP